MRCSRVPREHCRPFPGAQPVAGIACSNGWPCCRNPTPQPSGIRSYDAEPALAPPPSPDPGPDFQEGSGFCWWWCACVRAGVLVVVVVAACVCVRARANALPWPDGQLQIAQGGKLPAEHPCWGVCWWDLMPLRCCPSPQHGVQPGVTAHRSAPQVYTAPFPLLRSWAVTPELGAGGGGAASLRAVRPWLGWAAPRDEARSAIHSATVGNLAPTFQRFSTPDLTNREVLALTPSYRALI